MENVRFFESIPDFFFELNQKNILDHLEEMTLFYHEGDKEETVLLSTMLHGNETSGLFAIQKYLKNMMGMEGSPSFLILLGNPKAFHENKRLIPGQLDRNRIWQLHGGHRDHKLSKEVINKVVNYPLIFSVDIHNNTGKNPYFCCVNRLDRKTLGLASLFNADALFFEDPDNAFSTYIGRFCPSVTLECGMSGDDLGVEKAIKFFEESVKLSGSTEFQDKKFKNNVFKSFGKFKLNSSTNIRFIDRDSKEKLDLQGDGVAFFNDLEKFNLKILPKGEKLGYIFGDVEQVKTVSEFDEDLFDDLFLLNKNSELVVKDDFYAAMVTKDIEVAKADCFFYFLKKLSI